MSVLASLAVPSPWVTRFAPLIARDRTVLDVACGNGRHTRLFADRGNQVTAVDIDLRGIADLADLQNVEGVRADLEGATWPFGERRFGAIIVANYHHRPLLPHLLAALEPSGIVIYESYAAGNQHFGGPGGEALLRPGELLRWTLETLQIVAYEHGEVASPKASVIQRLVAVRRSNSAIDPSDQPKAWPLPSP